MGGKCSKTGGKCSNTEGKFILPHKVKWTGYGPEENIWLWPNNIQAKDLIQEYEEKQHWTTNERGPKWGQKQSHGSDRTLSLYHNWISIAGTSPPVKRS